ncbi:MAG TPA: DUF1799 domain-containing protein [Pseudorhodoferax sp.]|nr:DUF1799 domain-containing protein [Pseudorhodoferax sp.]
MMGMSRADWEDEQTPLEVWPENLPAYNLWQRVGDQWRMGFGGPVSIDLIPVFHELDRMGLEREDYDNLLADIQTMARAVIDFQE